MNIMIKTYSELIRFPSFQERFDYLKFKRQIGISTFGFDRYLNQNFYQSKEWKHVRNTVIIRDNSCDLGILDRPIFGGVRIHHLNPITVEDFEEGSDFLLNSEFLICVSLQTHNAIHFGDENNLIKEFKERRKGDTKLW